MFGSICSHFHWQLDYLLWRIPWITVQMMLADMPSYEHKEEDKFDDEQELINYLNEQQRRGN